MQNGSADQKMHEMQEEQLLALHFPLGNVHCLLLPGRSVANQLKIKRMKIEMKKRKQEIGRRALPLVAREGRRDRLLSN